MGEVERLVTASEEEGFEYFFESLHAVRALRAHRNQLRDHNEQLARACPPHHAPMMMLLMVMMVMPNALALLPQKATISGWRRS